MKCHYEPEGHITSCVSELSNAGSFCLTHFLPPSLSDVVFGTQKQAKGIMHKAICCFAFWQPCLGLCSLIQTTIASDVGRLCVRLPFCSVDTGIICPGGRAAGT